MSSIFPTNFKALETQFRYPKTVNLSLKISNSPVFGCAGSNFHSIYDPDPYKEHYPEVLLKSHLIDKDSPHCHRFPPLPCSPIR